MSQSRKTSSFVWSAAVFILFEIAALAMLKSSSVRQDTWINKASHKVLAVLWGRGEMLRNHFNLLSTNDILVEENAELHERLRVYEQREESLRENDNIVNYPTKVYRFISGTVVKVSRNSSHNYIIINKGSEDGVKPQSGIISSKGVVGIVTAVSDHFSYGLTLMNSNISIGSRLGKTDVVAPLSWKGTSSNGAVINNIPPHHIVEHGDTVRTSGYSSIFPPGLPIGVTGESKLVDGSTLQADVTLFQDFNTLHYVTIVERLDRDEIFDLEKEGGTIQ